MAKERIAPAPSTSEAAATAIGKAVLANRHHLLLSGHALLHLIVDKLATLDSERPNSKRSQDERDRSIAEYTKLLDDLNSLINAIRLFEVQSQAETEVVRTTKTFAEGVRTWWTTSHEKICEKAYDLGVFGSAVSMLTSRGGAAVEARGRFRS